MNDRTSPAMRRAAGTRSRARFSASVAAVSTVVALVLAGCGAPDGAAAASASGEFADPDWQALVDEASGQSLNIISHPTEDYAHLVDAFQEAFPDIDVELTGSRPSDISPRVISEQAAGVFQWDVVFAATANMTNVLLPAGALVELPPLYVLDGITDDAKWGGGFGFYSADTPHILVTGAENISGTFVNRDLVPDAAFDDLADVANPEFRGKIVSDDCTVPAHGVGALVSIGRAAGPDAVSTMLADQDVTFLDTFRSVTEAVADGQYAIAIGGDRPTLRELQEAGVGTNVEMFPMPPGATNLTTVGVAVFKNAPNAAAAKVFVNWFLSQEGQEAYVQAFRDVGRNANSRRLDVTVGDEATRPQWESLNADDLFSWTTAVGSSAVQDAIAMCKEARGQ